MERVDYEKVVQDIGTRGQFQVLTLIFIYTLQMFSSVLATSDPIITGYVEHSCRIPALHNGTMKDFNKQYIDELKSYIPTEKDFFGKEKLSTCLEYVNITTKDETRKCTNGYVYYPEEQGLVTAVIEFELVCERRFLLSTARAFVMMGNFVGVIIVSLMSDRYGRKKTLFAVMITMLLGGMGQALSNDMIKYLVFRFITGLVTSSSFLLGFIVLSELLGPNERLPLVLISESLYGVATALIAFPFAFFIRNWRHLQISLSIIMIPLFTIIWIYPESPRWLLSKNHNRRAATVLCSIAKANRREVPQTVIQTLKNGPIEESRAIPFSKFLKNRKFSRELMLQSYIWIVVCMLFFGLTFRTDKTGMGILLGMALSGLAETPGIILAYIGMKYLGRRPTMIILLSSASVFCALTVFATNAHLLRTILVQGAKMFASGCFGVIYVWSSELIPTVLRNSGMGCCSTIGRIGSIAVPYINQLGDYLDESLIYIIYSIVGISGVLASCYLPETVNNRLPDTYENYKDQRKYSTNVAINCNTNFSAD